VHGAPIPTPKGRELSRLSVERASGSAGRTYWLKMLYYDERDLDRWWETMTWVSDVHRPRERDGEPLLRPSYRIGDLLVLYLVGRACPAIAEVKGEPVSGVAPSSVRQHGHIRISADVYVHALRAIEATRQS
jgi:hypothetical protein